MATRNAKRQLSGSSTTLVAPEGAPKRQKQDEQPLVVRKSKTNQAMDAEDATTNSSLSPRARGDYTVAVICTVHFALEAVCSMLDHQHDPLPRKKGDSNIYVYGELGGHNTVITCLPGTQGKSAAALVVNDFARTFPSIELRLLVGIGGGVPDQDVRLGDVVVSMPDGQSTGVVQYDLGKQETDKFALKGFLWPIPRVLAGAATRMRSDHATKPSEIEGFLSALLKKGPEFSIYQSPPLAKDVVFRPDYPHKTGQKTCDECNRHQTVGHRSDRTTPLIHYGLIASGDRVIKCAKTRDDIVREMGNILCFEMEAAGIQTGYSCIVIRGISNYADSHKNDEWQEYAAAVAAACAKELLQYVEPEESSDASIVAPHPRAVSEFVDQSESDSDEGSSMTHKLPYHESL